MATAFSIPTFLIYCAELKERTESAVRELESRNVHFSGWQSIHGKTWGLQTVKEYDPGCTISPGHVGLLLGHWSLWNHLRHALPVTDFANAIVFEDDVEIPHDYHVRLAQLLTDLEHYNPKWELCFLGLAEKEPQVWGKVTERIGGPDSPLCRLSYPFGTHAYIIRRKALAPLLENMRIAHRNMDQQLYERVLKDNHINWCARLPSFIRQKTYDYDGKGKPDWAPSTIDEPTALTPNQRTETEGKQIFGESPFRANYSLWEEMKNIQEAVDRQFLSTAPARAQSQAVQEATLKLTDPFPCIYRGEFLTHSGTDPFLQSSVPLSQCARFNKACHSKRDTFLVLESTDPNGAQALSCASCKHRLGMELATRTRDRLPLPDGHFNPSLILWNDRLILATRDSWGHSKISLWEVKNLQFQPFDDISEAIPMKSCTIEPLGSYSSDHPDAPRLEDPRLFYNSNSITGQKLCAMFNLPDGYPPKHVKVGYAELPCPKDMTADGGVIKMNIYDSPTGSAYEKNWMPFAASTHDGKGELLWIYATSPEHVIMGDNTAYRTPNPLPWTGGVIRGGAAPVEVYGDMRTLGKDDPIPSPTFFHFFHGCLKQPRGNIYTVGCAEFESRPPYRVLRQTATPLIWPDIPAAGEDVVKRYVVWPGGAVYMPGATKAYLKKPDENGMLGKIGFREEEPYWILALGIDDMFCRLVKIPHKTVINALNGVPEEQKTQTIRDTDIAHGVKR